MISAMLSFAGPTAGVQFPNNNFAQKRKKSKTRLSVARQKGHVLKKSILKKEEGTRLFT